MTEVAPERIEIAEARITDLIIRVSILGLFIYWSLALVRPFLPILIWAVIWAVALAPAHTWLSKRLGGRRGLAATLLTLLLLTVVIGPVVILANSFVGSVQSIAAQVSAGTLGLPVLPAFVTDLPMIGPQIATFWSDASANLGELLLRHKEILSGLGGAALTQSATLGLDLLVFLVSIGVGGVLLVPGPRLVGGGRRIAERILPPRGAKFVDLAGTTIRNVSRGVIGVALLQTLLIGIVFYFFGIPAAGLLSFVILILCVIQLGPALIVIPALIWAWLELSTGQALAMTIVLIPIMLVDNILKPLLMSRGLPTPTIVIFLGVLGGTLSYGMIGLFLGPAILAVFYDLLVSWIATTDAAAPEP